RGPGPAGVRGPPSAGFAAPPSGVVSTGNVWSAARAVTADAAATSTRSVHGTERVFILRKTQRRASDVPAEGQPSGRALRRTREKTVNGSSTKPYLGADAPRQRGGTPPAKRKLMR